MGWSNAGYRSDESGWYKNLVVAGGPAWNPADKASDLTLSNANKTVKNTVGGAHALVRSVASHTTGKYYCEMKADVQNFSAFSYFGVVTANQALSNFLGGTADSACTTGNGNINCNGSTVGPSDGYGTTGQTIGMAVDLTAKKVWFWTDTPNRWNGDILANQNPATGTGGANISGLAAGPYFLANGIYQLNDQTTLNLGGTAYLNALAITGFGNW